jgi:hypothetical protein
MRRINTLAVMNGYIPPAFPLYEFVPKEPAGGTDRRSPAGWDGLVGAPAADVLLAWERGPASVLVRTTDRNFEGAYARVVAAHLALGGTFLPATLRPVGPARIMREIERFRDDDGLWSPIPGLVPDATRTEAAAADGYSIAYTQFDKGAVFVAAVGVPLEDLRVRIAQG